MPTNPNIRQSLVQETVVRAVTNVFRTMAGQTVQFRDLNGEGGEDSRRSKPFPTIGDARQVVGTVGFVGEANGLIYLYFDADFASECTGSMLGINGRDASKIGEDAVNDAIGELTNMVVGTFKNGLCDVGFPCKLTIPSILRGRNITVTPVRSGQRDIYRFACRDHEVVADILMKADE